MNLFKKAITSHHKKVRKNMYKQTNTDGKYWYFYYHIECPVCGRDSGYKERKYSPKPKKAEERHSYKQEYDYCQETI